MNTYRCRTRNVLVFTCLCVVAFGSGFSQAEAPYAADWSSLRQHTTPEWLDRMKFGIYCHWGPQTIQLAHPEEELGTLEAIERWTGESFSAKEWVDLFEAAGAQFAGPVAWHGSGLLNWDSKRIDRSSVKRDPCLKFMYNRRASSSFHRSMRGTRPWGNRTADEIGCAF